MALSATLGCIEAVEERPNRTGDTKPIRFTYGGLSNVIQISRLELSINSEVPSRNGIPRYVYFYRSFLRGVILGLGAY